MEQESHHAEAPPSGAELTPGEQPHVQHEMHMAAPEDAQQEQHHVDQQQQHHQQLVAQHHHQQQLLMQQQHHHQQEGTPMDGAPPMQDHTQQLPVTMADSATVAAAIAAGLMGSGMGMAQLLASTPYTAAHAGALGMLGQPQGGEGLGDIGGMSGGAQRSGPASIPRGQEGYSRKAKSLSLLCENFVTQFGQVVNQVINLDNAASQLGVERRRIYDIVNVLESIKVVSKLQKNQYQWHGTAKLMDTLTELHEEAQREMEEAKTMSGEDLASLGLDDRKEKSMSRLSQRFVQMFMLSKTRSLGLDEAARALLGGNEDQGQYKTKVRRLYDIANILSALKIIEKTHVGDKGKPGFRWLGPEGLQSLRPMATSAHVAAAPTPTGPAFHLQPGSFQAALAGDLPPLNMAAVSGAGAVHEGTPVAGDGSAGAGGVQVSLPAPASLYIGGGEGGVGQQTGSGASGGVKRPRRKSLKARDGEGDGEGHDGEEEGEGEEDGDIGEEGAAKRVRVDQPADPAAQHPATAAVVSQHHSAAPGLPSMFSELPIVMPSAGDAAAAAAVAAAMASGAYGAVDMGMHAGQQTNKPKVHPLLKFMELESQTDAGGGGGRRMVGTDLVTDGAQPAWPAAAWGGMGMDWLTNPAMAASMYGSFWPASAYAANMAAGRGAKPGGVTAEGQPAGGEGEAGAPVEGDPAVGAGLASGEHAQQQQQAQHDAAAAAGVSPSLPQTSFPYGAQLPGAQVLKLEGAGAGGVPGMAPGAGASTPEGGELVGEAEGDAAGAVIPTSGAELAGGQPMMDAQAAAQAAAAGGNPLAWQYWQYMYSNLYANAAQQAQQQAANPAVYTNVYNNWTKKHDGSTPDGGVSAGVPPPPTDAPVAAPSPLPLGAYPVVEGEVVPGYSMAPAPDHHMQPQVQAPQGEAAMEPPLEGDAPAQQAVPQ